MECPAHLLMTVSLHSTFVEGGGGGGFADPTCEFNMMDKVRVYMYNLCTQWSVVGHFWLLAPEPHFLSVK